MIQQPTTNNQQPTTILVTGAGGQLGKTIEELYSKNNLEIDFTFVTKSELDITKKNDVESIFKNNNFHYCINCAAYTNVDQAEKTPEIAYNVNAEGVKNLAKACKSNHTILIHVSTDYVFDGEKGTPYTIEDIPNPINEYGRSKLLGEQYIQEILSNHFIVRTSWLYSKTYGKNFYRTIKALAEEKKEITVTADEIGSPTNTESLARYILDIVVENSTNYGIKHFSDGVVMSWYDFANQILSENKLINKTTLVKGNKYVTFAKRSKYSVLKIST